MAKSSWQAAKQLNLNLNLVIAIGIRQVWGKALITSCIMHKICAPYKSSERRSENL